jgi:tRNA (guanosine-2'-O-)-methyltransferase
MNMEKLINYLEQFAMPDRIERINQVIEQRTNYVAIAVEDIYQSHNANAVVRSAECFGVQNVHIIQNEHEFEINDQISMGSAKWLNIHNHTNTKSCIESLKQKGYLVAATLPAEKNVFIEDVPLDKPVAFLFGTEKMGLSEEAIAMSDICVKLPMYGFTESFNVSVSSALSLMSFVERLRKSNLKWQLNDEEKQELRLKFLKASIRDADKVEKRFYKKMK